MTSPPPPFGKYEILQLLGRGGMAEVYKARAVEGARAGQLVALKRLTPKLTTDPEELKRAEEALAEDMNEENLRRLQAILDRMRRESLESGTG